MLTAISVARDSGMVQTRERVIIVDALPPTNLQPASITWRYTENPGSTVTQVRVKDLNSGINSAGTRGLTVRTDEEYLKATTPSTFSANAKLRRTFRHVCRLYTFG